MTDLQAPHTGLFRANSPMFLLLNLGLPAGLTALLWHLGLACRWAPLLAALLIAVAHGLLDFALRGSSPGYLGQDHRSGLLWLSLLPPLLAGVGACIPGAASGKARAILFLGLCWAFALLVPVLGLSLGAWSP